MSQPEGSQSAGPPPERPQPEGAQPDGPQPEGAQQEGELEGPSHREPRTPLPVFLTGRLARIGLGAVASAVLVSAAFVQGAWNGDEASRRTSPVELDRAGDAEPDPSSPSVARAAPAPSPSATPDAKPKAKAKAKPKAKARSGSHNAHRSQAAEGSAGQRYGGSGSAGDGTSRTQVSGGSRVALFSASAAEAKPALSAWSSRRAEDNPYWDAHALTVRSTKPITSLKLSVRVMQTGGVTDSGAWTSLGDQVEIHSAANGEYLAYHIVLKAGITLKPGTHTFQFGFSHHQGNRDAGRDLWNVVATTEGSSDSQTRSGRF